MREQTARTDNMIAAAAASETRYKNELDNNAGEHWTGRWRRKQYIRLHLEIKEKNTTSLRSNNKMKMCHVVEPKAIAPQRQRCHCEKWEMFLRCHSIAWLLKNHIIRWFQQLQLYSPFSNTLRDFFLFNVWWVFFPTRPLSQCGKTKVFQEKNNTHILIHIWFIALWLKYDWGETKNDAIYIVYMFVFCMCESQRILLRRFLEIGLGI